MQKIEITESTKYVLDFTEGTDIDEKLTNLVRGDLERRLRECSERVFGYEKKYGMSFEQFESAWNNNEILDKHSHEVERDYMEWESLEDEHSTLLSKLKNLKEQRART